MLDRRLLIVTGKGGSGRSALSAALAIRAARTGRRVLAVGMTDGAGLAAHLGVERLAFEPREVRPGVAAMRIDRAAALDEYLHLQLRLPKAAPLGPIAKSLNLFADAVPGIRDLITTGKVLFDADSGQWDLVVCDAPPTGQILSYLRAPVTITGLVPSGRVREQAEWMTGRLADPGYTGLVVVALAEELPAAETEEALADLAAEPLADLAAVVVNRVLPELALSTTARRNLPTGAVADTARLHQGLWAAQQEWLDRLPAGPRLPFLFGLHTPGEVAARIADLWEVG